ncbi:MAG: Smr/MutS family protein [candidate division WOR-3 bacterium]|nr:Smr/MutS family protein [candidate division WOR-3 bacterium]
MKKLSKTVGLNRLLEIVAEYTESIPGRAHILNLKPNSQGENARTLERLSQVIEYQSLMPKLDILEEESIPGFGKILPSEKLLYFANILNLTKEVKDFFLDNDILKVLAIKLDPLPALREEILKSINEEGRVKVDASSRLKTLSIERKKLKSEIDDEIKRILQEKGDILQDNIITQRSGRTVLPVKYDRKEEIKGIVVDLSRSGNTAFIEPATLIPINNQLSEILIDIEEETKRILKVLTEKLRTNFQAIERNIDILAEVDSLNARARYARDFGCIIPDFTEKSILKLKGCRHPLLMREREVEPLDLEIGDNERILLVSGPNAGGKTVLLKTIGINILSAYAGLPIPSSYKTKIGIFKDIYGIIEDEQSIEENLSTFSSYIVRLKEILNKAGNDSLVLLDELGGNTDPEEGGALAISVLNDLKRKESLVISTTHLSVLKFYVEEHKGMENGAMEYVDGPTYHLQIGVPGGSRAIAVAEKLGLPRGIVNKAKELVDSSVLKAEELIEELSRRNKRLREQEEENQKFKSELAELIKDYNEKMNNIKKEQGKIIQEANMKAKEIVRGARSTVEKTIKKIRESEASRESIKQYKNIFKNLISEEKEEKEKIVYPSKEKINIDYDVDLEVPLEVSVLGMKKDEAWRETDKFLDRAVLAGYDSVRILHGKGSWILRNMIHEKLKNDPRVKAVSTPSRGEGGAGVTIAKLK